MNDEIAVNRWLRIRCAFDQLVGIVASALLAPAIAILALLVRRHDGHRGLIRVARVGRSGRPIAMWKVRSMRPRDESGTAGGPTLTCSDDDRITPIGRRLRQLHLDEVPQILNVARGEMLLLGPRPESPEWVDLDDERWRRVLAAPPGVAGPTQLIVDDWERSVIDSSPDGEAYQRVVVPVKLAIDTWYLRRATPALDLLVVASMFEHVLTGRRPLALERRVERDVPEAAVPLAWLAEQARVSAAQLGRSADGQVPSAPVEREMEA